MRKPPPLKPGDKIAIVAPARRVNPADLSTAINTFTDWGLDVTVAESIKSNNHSYLAGSDDERLKSFQDYIDDPSIKAIISARGGYGSTRILDQLNLSSLAENPKWIIGFSDITAVHLKLYKSGFASIHGTMPILFSDPKSQPSIESLQSVLFQNNFSIACDSVEINRTGESEGILVGGNLSLIVDSLGTSTEINTDNCILLIEEIDEYFYRIDRMIMQLKRAGKLKMLKGLVVGHMTDIKESTLAFNEAVEQIILNAIKDYQFPVAFNFPSGHEDPNLAWIHGAPAYFKVSKNEVILRSL